MHESIYIVAISTGVSGVSLCKPHISDYKIVATSIPGISCSYNYDYRIIIIYT